ncbi:MAG: ParB/RepB/Spo0J family partition protein [Alphaproteobacteria bacterium]|jgi:ParB family chromosome partitioning protein|nr:ParB/RepB/Spo0J family partition protein [Alphaproteobacteria bacterium]
MVETRRGLGRGLSALLEETEGPLTPERRAELGVFELPIEKLWPNPDQPRKRFDPELLEELSQSIRQRGMIQPILARPHPDHAGDYQIVAGERRWRAAQMAELRTVPVVARALTSLEVMEIALIENLQRADLDPLEEGRAYQMMMREFDRSAEEVAQAVGRSRSHVANTVRLLRLPEPILAHLAAGRLTAGHARALLDRDDAPVLAERIVREGLNVRQTEALAARREPRPDAARPRGGKDADTAALESDLSEMLGLPVEIRDKAGAGVLSVRYASLEQLDEICRRLSTRPGRAN